MLVNVQRLEPSLDSNWNREWKCHYSKRPSFFSVPRLNPSSRVTAFKRKAECVLPVAAQVSVKASILQIKNFSSEDQSTSEEKTLLSLDSRLPGSRISHKGRAHSNGKSEQCWESYSSLTKSALLFSFSYKTNQIFKKKHICSQLFTVIHVPLFWSWFNSKRYLWDVRLSLNTRLFSAIHGGRWGFSHKASPSLLFLPISNPQRAFQLGVTSQICLLTAFMSSFTYLLLSALKVWASEEKCRRHSLYRTQRTQLWLKLMSYYCLSFRSCCRNPLSMLICVNRCHDSVGTYPTLSTR